MLAMAVRLIGSFASDHRLSARCLEKRLGVSVDLVHIPLPQDSFLEVGETVMLYEHVIVSNGFASIAKNIRQIRDSSASAFQQISE